VYANPDEPNKRRRVVLREELSLVEAEALPSTTGAQVEERVAARLARQEVLEREVPPLVWVLLDENVLHREVGGAKIMRDQLCRLADMGRRPNVTVQVISRAGAHPGLSGAFGIAELSDRHTVAYLETAADGQTVEDPATVADVELRFDALRTEAFRGTESLVLIENEADRWNP